MHCFWQPSNNLIITETFDALILQNQDVKKKIPFNQNPTTCNLHLDWFLQEEWYCFNNYSTGTFSV